MKNERPKLGITLQPEKEYLTLLDPIFRSELVEYFQVAPETTWYTRQGELFANGFSQTFLQLGQETKKPFVAHGVGFSAGSMAEDVPRKTKWLARLKEDQKQFQYLWYTDHFGVSSMGGLAATLPIPIWMNDAAGELVRERLALMREVTNDVGLENSVFYFLLGSGLDEASFLQKTLSEPYWMLLDLHNLYTLSVNFGVSPKEYVARLDLARVIEIHIAGGTESDPNWLPSKKVIRLDSHDHSIPEEVWGLLEEVLPRCTQLRGVTLERMEGTVTEEDIPKLQQELQRAKRLIEVHS
jgi:uncharacterized protein (UPF0276 family)